MSLIVQIRSVVWDLEGSFSFSQEGCRVKNGCNNSNALIITEA